MKRTLNFKQTRIRNGIRTQEERATLIDWECSGLGIAIADLGSLLLHCHFDQFDNLEYRPDPQRIAAVVQGYCHWRSPGSEELTVLLEAIRFSIS
jgi:thiamine kinase-like enzyme